jgi:hypothetical protein
MAARLRREVGFGEFGARRRTCRHDVAGERSQRAVEPDDQRVEHG